MGRPSTYEASKVQAILELVADGYSLNKACKLYDTLESTFRLWCKDIPEVDAKYRRAREDRANRWAEEMVEIPDSVDLTGDPNVVRLRLEQAKQKVDVRKWITSRILPKDYGDKIDLNHGGEVAIKRVVADL